MPPACAIMACPMVLRPHPKGWGHRAGDGVFGEAPPASLSYPKVCDLGGIFQRR